MKIMPKDIQDNSFRKLLFIFKELNLQLAVWGGACRDLMLSIIFPEKYPLSKQINDFDISIILHKNIKFEMMDYRDFGESYRIIPIVRRKLKRLCDYWKIRIEDLCCEENIMVPNLEYPVGIAGLRIIYDSNGHMFPDCFALNDKRTINAVPTCITINSFAIDGSGNIYGPLEYLNDFETGTARLLREPKINMYAVPLLLRLIDYIRRFELVPEKKTRALLSSHLDELHSVPEVIKASKAIPWTQKLFEKEFCVPLTDQPSSEVFELISKRFRFVL